MAGVEIGYLKLTNNW